MLQYKTNGEVLDKAREDLIGLVLERVELMLLFADILPALTARERMWLHLVDPVKIFIKNEPHKEEKVATGRLRYISSLSVVDSVVQRLVCSSQNNVEIQHWDRVPSKPGIGFTDEMIRSFIDGIPAGELRSDDMSGWDNSFKGWMFDMGLERRLRLCSGHGTVFGRLLKAVFTIAKKAVLVYSDGTMSEQLVEGIMKSGMYITSADNSSERVMLAYCAGFSFAVAMGDDCLTSNDGDASLYAAYGVRPKDGRVSNDTWEFCSHEWNRNGAVYPVRSSLEKMLFRLAHKVASPSELEQFLEEVRHYPDQDEVLRLLLAIGYDGELRAGRWCPANAAQATKEEGESPSEEEASSQSQLEPSPTTDGY